MVSRHIAWLSGITKEQLFHGGRRNSDTTTQQQQKKQPKHSSLTITPDIKDEAGLPLQQQQQRQEQPCFHILFLR